MHYSFLPVSFGEIILFLFNSAVILDFFGYAPFVSSNLLHCEVYLTQRYVIKFVSYLRQVGGFLSSTNKTDLHDIAELLLKVARNIINQTKQNQFYDTHICVILFWQKQNESTPVRLNDICNACLSRSYFTEIRKSLSGNNYNIFNFIFSYILQIT
jgi:DNA-dependent RNA polymerase auxiliary subunit epsilon